MLGPAGRPQCRSGVAGGMCESGYRAGETHCSWWRKPGRVIRPTSLTAMGLLAQGRAGSSGRFVLIWKGSRITQPKPTQMRAFEGRAYRDEFPKNRMTALNPVCRVGEQIEEVA